MSLEDLRRARLLLQWAATGRARYGTVGRCSCAASPSEARGAPFLEPMVGATVPDPSAARPVPGSTPISPGVRVLLDVAAQRALARLTKDPATAGDAQRIRAALEAKTLGGIYIVNQKVPALRAQRLGTWWAKVIPRGRDSAVLLDPKDKLQGTPILVVREGISGDAGRFDAALLRAWSAFEGFDRARSQGRIRTDQNVVSGDDIGADSLVPLPGVVPQLRVDAPNADRCDILANCNTHRPIKGAKGQPWVAPEFANPLAGQIFFSTGSAQLDNKDMEQLDKLVDAYDFPLREHARRGDPPFHFRIVGFADHRRYEGDNKVLSADRACMVRRHLDNRLCGHPNYISTAEGRGVDPVSETFPTNEEALAGFRRVDIFAPPAVVAPTPPPEIDPPIDAFFATRFAIRIKRGAILFAVHPRTKIGLGALQARVEVVALNAESRPTGKKDCIAMAFSLDGPLIVRSGGRIPVGLTTISKTCFRIFETADPIRIRDVQGFTGVFIGGPLITLELFGPMHQGGTKPVNVNWAIIANNPPSAGFDALRPLGNPQRVVSPAIRKMCEGDEALLCKL